MYYVVTITFIHLFHVTFIYDVGQGLSLFKQNQLLLSSAASSGVCVRRCVRECVCGVCVCVCVCVCVHLHVSVLMLV